MTEPNQVTSPTEELDDKTIARLQTATNWAAELIGFGGGGLLFLGGAAGLVTCLLDWSSFYRGYHYVWVNLRTTYLIGSVTALYVGTVLLRSAIHDFRERSRR